MGIPVSTNNRLALRNSRRLSRVNLGSLGFVVLCALAFWPLASSSQSSSSKASSRNPKASSPARELDASPRPGQKTFSSPQEASAALEGAARKNDEDTLVLILGPDAKEVILWTDAPADRRDETAAFAQKYAEMHRLVREPDREVTLYIGAENWPLPIPLVEKNGVWFFDIEDGKKEILYRRIGENELDAIAACRSLADAEKEYFAASAPSPANREFADKFESAPGQHDGLYWPTASNAPQSPVGPRLADANFDQAGHVPFHGYLFRVLTKQGSVAPGGAKNYMADGRMKGGFAFVAFPAQYRSSGVMTFLVGQSGIVFERDLGNETESIAEGMTQFNPTPGWRKVPADELQAELRRQ